MIQNQFIFPSFSSLDEEAEFWDTHSAADYWEKMTPVEVRFVRPPYYIFGIRLGDDQ